MTKPECPLLQVEDVLAPYIHPREKTTRIRQILTEHIRRQVKDDSDPTHLALSIPPSSLRVKGSISSTNGLYEQYLKALEAHQQARERYDEVKIELDQLQQPRHQNGAIHGSHEASRSVNEYADLLRQRRHQRKLEIVQDALTKLLDTEPNPAATDVKTAVREELGEALQPPVATNAEGGSSDANARVRDLTFQLKKEVLLAKNRYADTKAAKEGAEARHVSDNDARDAVEILRKARDELIGWVEGELSKIPEDEVEASQADISFFGGDEDGDEINPLSNEELLARVEHLYEQYIGSRQRYIAEVEAALERASRLQDASNVTSGAPLQSPRRPTISSSSTSTTSTITAAELLPSLACLHSTAQATSLLQSQTGHLRKQLITASSETQALIQRLAGESLLVPQDSTGVSAWSKAGIEASEKTKEAVMSNVIEGEASAAQAKKVLEGLRARRRGLEGLRRDL
jgi:hypothetical protein